MTYYEQADVLLRAFEAGHFDDLVDEYGRDGGTYYPSPEEANRRADALLGEGTDVRAIVHLIPLVSLRAADLVRGMIR